MKFIISSLELNYLINKIQNVVSLKPPMPVLSNFLIEAFNDELIFIATDLTVGIRCATEATILEEGSITLPAKKFAQLVREFPTLNVEISSNKNDVVTVIAGTSRFKLNGMDAKTYPALPDFAGAVSFKLSQADLKELFYRTAFAVAREENRYLLIGIYMQISNGVATFTGTDGKRLARSTVHIEIDPLFHYQSIIPLKAVEEVLKNLQDEGDATVYLMPDKIGFEANQSLLIAKLLVGDYPDLNRIIPEKSDLIIPIHREELMTLLRQISLFLNQQHLSARFSFQEGELHLVANAVDIGEGNVSMVVDYQGPQFEIALNPVFFLDMLRHCKEEVVTLGLNDAYSPGVLTDGLKNNPPQTNVSSLFLIMPMRLTEA